MESIFSGRTIVSGDKAPQPQEPGSSFRPLFVPAPPPPPAPVPICDDQGEPQVEVVNGKNGIERLIITCACGKRIELKCEYE